MEVVVVNAELIVNHGATHPEPGIESDALPQFLEDPVSEFGVRHAPRSPVQVEQELSGRNIKGHNGPSAQMTPGTLAPTAGSGTMKRRTIAETSPTDTIDHDAAVDDVRGWRFDVFEFDLRRGELRGRDGTTIALRPKAEALLRVFLARPGQLLGREELIGEIWRTMVVTDDSLVQCVGEVRAALADHDQQLIRTVPRRGYRFETKVERILALPASPDVRTVTAAIEDLPRSGVVAQEVPTAVAQGSLVARDAVHSTAALRSRVFGGIALAVGAALCAAAWLWRAPPPLRGIDEQIAARHTVAVMPFAFEPAAPGPREIADRLADKIAAQIATNPGTRVFSPTRTASMRGAPTAQIANELGAVYVLTGHLSPPTSASHVAGVDVQVVSAPDGVLLGAEHFELGRGADAGADVAEQVLSFMYGQFRIVDEARATRPGHAPDATDLTLLGWIAVYRRLGAADMKTARANFERALEVDPDSIAALDGIGAVYIQERQTRAPLTPEQIARAEQSIERALRLAPNDATAPMLWGQQQALNGRPDLAIPAIEKANRLTPGFVNGHLILGRLLLSVGRISEASGEADRAGRLATLSRDPVRLSAALQLGAEVAIMQRDDSRALVLARRAVAERPASGTTHAVLAAAEALAGQAAQAEAEMAISRRLLPGLTIERFDRTWPSKEPRYIAARMRFHDGLRDAGMPER